ncbi:hypothetical protein [Thalassospira sp. MCCC 1A02491]|uniref:hypothetical protein n=1 Tax=Thalassospira sp. MCCC 1A02491 TaxID=1769751 RepID=UPI0007AD6DDD|nr:hypothetical protein [Thalassospira sp. MCCC 1A02491]KZB67859.1 hypothetical protein AUQ42_12880 [Thalassospira sp. MCCC 1A02491]
MPRSPNGLKDDAFENHAKKKRCQNHAQKRCPEHGAPATMCRKEHPGDDTLATMRHPRRLGNHAPPGVVAKLHRNHSGTASREIAIFLIFRKN